MTNDQRRTTSRRMASLVRAMLGPNDLAGHFGASSLLLMLERGNSRDAEAWCESLIERVAKHNFQLADQDLHVTCSVGLATAPSSDPNLDSLVQETMDAARRTAERGGNQVLVSEQVDHDTRVLAYDQVWVKHIKAALADNRFHLVQQPIASLNGDAQKVYDVAVRMRDLQGREVLPSEFLPAAERNDLMKSIDRWVLGAALAFAAKRQPDLLFVRISKDSLVDTTLMSWLDVQLKNSLAEPQRRRWIELLLDCADEVGLPADPEFRSAFVAYLEWGSRLAVINSQPGAAADESAPMPHWGWGEPKGPYQP